MQSFVLLTKQDLAKGLSEVVEGPTGQYGFVRLDLRGKNITSLEGDLTAYSMLRYIDFSANIIPDISALERLPDLHAINLKDNKITSLCDFGDQVNLQVVELDDNKISSLSPFKMPTVRSLSISQNNLTDFAGLSHIHVPHDMRVLDVSFNKIESCSGLEKLEKLSVLNLQANKIKSIDGLESLPHLTQLDLRDNNLPSIMIFRALAGLKQLRYLATSGNPEIEKVDEENPDASTPEALMSELLILLPQLTRWNETDITEEHREAAKALQEERDAAAAAKAAELAEAEAALILEAQAAKAAAAAEEED